ncbi:MAG: hypothetical protein RL431_126 [Actinomycetota bacterium]|jgi:flagellar motility protein MotE (MotC chaperone)/sporulation protein YlmC with PRC-barrel domain
MSSTRVYVARLAGCSVFDPFGDRVGRVRDVIVVYRTSSAPVVVGLLIEVPGRRRVFLGINRVTSIRPGQILTTGLINMRRFEQKGGEVRIFGELIGRTMNFRNGSGLSTIEDVAIESNALGEWAVSQLYMRKQRDKNASLFAKGPAVFARWDEVTPSEDTGESQSAEHLVASYAELLPADLAASILDLPEERRIEVAEELSDERLADALEEMPESEQVEIIQGLDDDRAADILDQMEPDDAADLIAQLPKSRGDSLLDLMDPEEAEDVRFLLSYDPDSAGGLMSTEPIIVSAETTVAEGLALIRRSELTPAMAASVCVTLPPYESPTGRFLGMVHFQRMLRYPPQTQLGTLLDTRSEPLLDTTSAGELARTFASYNLVSLPVVDDQHRLLGVVTVDDVLDHMLPDDWRNPYYDNDPVKEA